MRSKIQTILTYTLPAFLLMSCSHNPQREPPMIPMEEKFSDTGEIKLEQKWWESLHDPMLNALVDKALAGNFSLKTVWSRMDQATAIARQAGANLSPTLDAVRFSTTHFTPYLLLDGLQDAGKLPGQGR